MMRDFEDYLMEKHAEQYIGTKDCMIDDFNKWVQDLGFDELIEYGNTFVAQIKSEILEKVDECETIEVAGLNTLILKSQVKKVIEEI